MTALAVTTLGALVLWFRYRRGTLLTGTGGLHVNVFLFIGLGLLAYVVEGELSERVPTHFVMQAIAVTAPYVVVGYGIVALRELRWPVKPLRVVDFSVSSVGTPKVLLVISTLALVGYLGSLSEAAVSGLGTIFPVLKSLLYPGLVMAIASVRLGDMKSAILAAGYVLAVGVLALGSPWRSETIVMSAACCLAILLRRPDRPLRALILAVLVIALAIPFAHEKKVRYDEVTARPVQTLTDLALMPIGERLAILTGFWAVRIDSAREIGYVVDGLESGVIGHRGGLTYWEAVQQLVPRVIWPGKPSFNETTNYYLARQLGLVGWDDVDTSWGVSLFAEAVWNFGIAALVIFIPAMFTLTGWVDRRACGQMRHEITGWLVRIVLFFLFLAVVGLVNATTYVVWGVLTVKGLDVWLSLGRQRLAPARMPRALGE
jgi:hypothetical protein